MRPTASQAQGWYSALTCLQGSCFLTGGGGSCHLIKASSTLPEEVKELFSLLGDTSGTGDGKLCSQVCSSSPVCLPWPRGACWLQSPLLTPPCPRGGTESWKGTVEPSRGGLHRTAGLGALPVPR